MSSLGGSRGYLHILLAKQLIFPSMLSALLLQTTSSTTQGTPITVYVTLIAAALATLASLNATIVSSKTAREVAALSAKTTQESARLAAQTAQELKEKDYKNDFYKKLIERRLNAWAEAEQFMKHIADVTKDVADGRNLFSYFNRIESFVKVVNSLNDSLLSQVIWIGGDYNNIVVAFRQQLLDIWNECGNDTKYDENHHSLIDKRLLWNAGKKYYPKLSDLYGKMAVSLTTQLSTLHDIDGFLKQTKA